MATPDEYDYETAMQWLEERNIDYDGLESLDEMITLIKITMGHESNGVAVAATQEHVSKPEMSKDTQRMMAEILSRDQEMKSELSLVYEKLMGLVSEEVSEDIKEVLKYSYGEHEMKSNMEELVNDECPIVVAGETSAGKSSLLNLLLEEEVLPHSLLCATSTICRLRNSEQKSFKVTTEGGESETINIEKDDTTWKEKLKQCVSSKETKHKNKYEVMDMFWPIPMLQDRVTIVDTPGVGESDEMTEKLMKYLPNAVAFIYVINSALAGGIQDDKLLLIIDTLRRWENDGKLSYLDSSNVIFVCNKWDIVEESNETDDVWRDTMEKLRKVLPDLTDKQVFRMSTSEASRYIKTGMGRTDKFQALLEGIETMILASLKAKVIRHFKWVERFLNKLQDKVSARINHARETAEEKQQLRDTLSARLVRLQENSKQVKTKLTDEAKKKCKSIASELHSYLNSEEVSIRLTSWQNDEAPTVEADDFCVTKFNAEELILKRIQRELKAWETANGIIKDLTDGLTALFTAECYICGKECQEIELIIQGISLESDMQKVIGTSQATNKQAPLFSGGEKIILAVAAPLWIPVVAAASLVFIPFSVSMLIRDAVSEGKQRMDYEHNKTEFMCSWTRDIIKIHFTKENIEQFTWNTYFNSFDKKIEKFCNEFIPKEIAANQMEIQNIVDDMRSTQEILKQFKPMQEKLTSVLKELYMYGSKFNLVS